MVVSAGSVCWQSAALGLALVGLLWNSLHLICCFTYKEQPCVQEQPGTAGLSSSPSY